MSWNPNDYPNSYAATEAARLADDDAAFEAFEAARQAEDAAEMLAFRMEDYRAGAVSLEAAMEGGARYEAEAAAFEAALAAPKTGLAVLKPAPRKVSKSRVIKSLMEDSGYSRSEARALAAAGFGEAA